MRTAVPDHADLKLRLGQFLAIDGLHVAMDLFQRSEAQHEHPALVILERHDPLGPRAFP